MKTLPAAVAAVAAATLASAQTGPTPQIIARVNERPISAGEFADGIREAVARLNFASPHRPVEARREAVERLGSDVLRRLVEAALIRAEAEKRGIAVSGREVRLRRLHEQGKFKSEAEFKDMLLRTGVSLQAFDGKMELALLEHRLAAAIQREPVSDDEVARYFEAHRAEFATEANAHPALADVEAAVRARAAERKQKFGYLDWLRAALAAAQVKVLVDEIEVPQLNAKTPLKWPADGDESKASTGAEESEEKSGTDEGGR